MYIPLRLYIWFCLKVMLLLLEILCLLGPLLQVHLTLRLWMLPAAPPEPMCFQKSRFFQFHPPGNSCVWQIIVHEGLAEELLKVTFALYLKSQTNNKSISEKQ